MTELGGEERLAPLPVNAPCSGPHRQVDPAEMDERYAKGFADAMEYRDFAGKGVVPLTEVAARLLAAGWSQPEIAEVLARTPDEDELAVVEEILARRTL